MRYSVSDEGKNPDRGRILRTTVYPSAEELTEGPTTVIQADHGDRLDRLAYEYYNDSSLWWIIAAANNLPGDTLHVDPGTQLEIPRDVGGVLNKLKQANK